MRLLRVPSADISEPAGHDAGSVLSVIRGSPEWWSVHWRRTAAILAILTLLIGTHIPKLVIGQPGDGPDKLLHFFAFGMIPLLKSIHTCLFFILESWVSSTCYKMSSIE